MFKIIEALTRPLNLQPDQALLKAREWWGQLQHFDGQTLNEAARAHCREKKNWPSIAEIIEACREVRRELRERLPQQRPSYRDENWHPPTPVEKARVTLLAHAVRERLGYDWYVSHMARGDDHLIAEAVRVKALTEGARA